MKAIAEASEKGAQIARACRREKDLFKLLVQKKDTSTEVDCQDFKTLADVLIQETVRYDLAQQFPALANNIRGKRMTFKQPKNTKSLQCYAKYSDYQVFS